MGSQNHGRRPILSPYPKDESVDVWPIVELLRQAMALHYEARQMLRRGDIQGFDCAMERARALSAQAIEMQECAKRKLMQ